MSHVTKRESGWKDLLTWQILITLILSILLFLWDRNNKQGYIVSFVFSILGLYLTFQTVIIKKHFEENLLPLQKIEEILDLNADTQVFKELKEHYLRITDDVFADVKNDIVRDAVTSLREISQTKALMLNKSQFYDQIFQLLEFGSIHYKRIWAVSMLLEHEWVDDQYERKFLKENFKATENNVVLERIFVIPDEQKRIILSNENHPITRHFLYYPPAMMESVHDPNEHKTKFCKTCKIREKCNVRPYIASASQIKTYHPGLLKQTYGFIAFDDRLIFIDTKEPDDENFSRISTSDEEIKKAAALFSMLKRYDDPVCCKNEDLQFTS
jgi:hypothetical protein